MLTSYSYVAIWRVEVYDGTSSLQTDTIPGLDCRQSNCVKQCSICIIWYVKKSYNDKKRARRKPRTVISLGNVRDDVLPSTHVLVYLIFPLIVCLNLTIMQLSGLICLDSVRADGRLRLTSISILTNRSRQSKVDASQAFELCQSYTLL